MTTSPLFPVAELPATTSEAQLQRMVEQYLHLRGWLYAHTRPVWTARGWTTPTTGDLGLPDLVCTRGGVVKLIELKARRGVVTPMQKRWLESAGEHGYLIRPSDWPRFVREFR